MVTKKNQEGKNTIETNPCFEEQELSYQCFSKYNYDKEKCTLQIENYKACKNFWVSVSIAYLNGSLWLFGLAFLICC